MQGSSSEDTKIHSTIAHIIVVFVISSVGMMIVVSFKDLFSIDGPELFLVGVIAFSVLLFFYDDLHTLFTVLLGALTPSSNDDLANYEIEEIYLISTAEGNILYHYAALVDHPTQRASYENGESDTDPDIIDGMLTTVQEFCTDSMKIDERDQLNVLRFGSKKVLIEHGESAYIVVIGRGEDDGEVLELIQQILSRLQRQYGDLLDEWGGDGHGDDDRGARPDLTPFFAPILGYS